MFFLQEFMTSKIFQNLTNNISEKDYGDGSRREFNTSIISRPRI